MTALLIGGAGLDAAPVPERFALMERCLTHGGIRSEYSHVPSSAALVKILRALRPDIVFSAPSHTADPPRSRRNIHALLEEERVPYVGSSPGALDIALNKPGLKARWQRAGITTPAYLEFSAADKAGMEDKLACARGFPYIVKPSNEGNSRGLEDDSVVRDAASLRKKLLDTIERFGDAFIEEFVGDGDVAEFTVAMIGTGATAFYLPAQIRLKEPKAVRVITTADKEMHRTIASPIEDTAVRATVSAFAARALAIAGVRDYARCDVIMAGGALYAIEVNGQPMVPDPWFEACARGAGFDTTRYVNAIMLAAILRNKAEGFPGLIAPPLSLALFSDDERSRLQGYS